MANIVLVHGAFMGGWCFNKLRPILEGCGHKVYTPTLTGHAESEHLLTLLPINLDTHISDVAKLIEWHELQDVVLCGHSYGGMVITGVADRITDRIAALVYLDGEVPEDGDSIASLMPQVVPIAVENSSRLGGALVAPFPAEIFGTSEANREWVDSRTTPTPLACFTQRIALTGAHRSVAKRVLIYNSTPIAMESPVPGWYEALRYVPGHFVYSAEGGHNFMIDNPQAIADIMAEHFG